MTAAAVSMIAPVGTRAVNRGKASDADDGERTPFASLIGSDAAASSEKPAAKTRSGDADSPEPAEAAEATNDPNTPPQLPAWLLALREPPPAAPAGTALPADPAAGGAVLKGSTMLAGPGIGSSLGLDDLRALKAPPGNTPPTQTPAPAPTSLQADDGRLPTAGLLPADDAAAALPSGIAVLPEAGHSLDASQSAALDAALARLDPGSPSAATTSPAPIGVERAATPPAIPVPSASEAAASASALNASLANQTDAFGEPLSLHGHDAALRLGERLRWLTESGVQEARMQLHPRELGSVDIRIRIEGQGASVWFGADHPGARAALEATLPQLRERLASEGLQLTQTSVGSQTQQQTGSDGRQQAPPDADQRQTAFAAGRPSATGASLDGVAAAGPVAPRLQVARGLVDRYA